MTADRHSVQLVTTGTVDGSTAVSARGRVTSATAPQLLSGLAKVLADGVPVLLDLSDLSLEWTPAAEAFITAVTTAGGWPLARLVLFGADADTAERLRACSVPDSVPLVETAGDAVTRIDVRPARVSRRVDLPADPVSVAHAREVLRETCERWELPLRDDLETVVAELVGNAVEHARTPFRLRLVLDRSGFRVSVRDGRPGALPVPADNPGGLRRVARLSRSWGVLRYGDGKCVWAQLPLTRQATPPAPAEGDGYAEMRRRSSDPGRSSAFTTVSTPRRRRFATADPEHAHAFLRTVYGEHSLRLSDHDARPGFRLEYDGVVTNRFAIEHLAHGGPVEYLFAPSDALVVVHSLAGEVRIASRSDQLRVAAGDVVVCGSGQDLLVDSSRLDVEVVRLDGATVARLAAEITGFDAAAVPFDLSRPVSPARGAHWRAVVAHLRRDVLANDEVMGSPLSRAAVVRTLVGTLVETFPNPALDTLGGRGPDRRPTSAALRRAVRFIEEHAGDDIGLADIAAAAGIGARGLQLVFRRHADATPLEHLRKVRLERAHRELQAATAAEATVGTIADRWGFSHHGNFSALYLRTYGRSPSVTLRS